MWETGVLVRAVGHVAEVQCHSLVCGIQFSLHPLLHPFPVVCSWPFYRKFTDHIGVSLFLGSLFCSVVCFYTIISGDFYSM